MSAAPPAPPLRFDGWRMVGVAFFAHLVSSGLGFYALPRLLVPLAEQFSGGDRAGVALLTAAMSLPGIAIGPLVGRSLTRFPLRTVMPVSAAVFALGFVAASRATSLGQLVAIYATTVPLAVSALGAVGANALVGNWFERRRPFALGVAQFGLSIAGALMPFFISWTLADGSWRSTYLWFAGIAAASGLVLRFAIVERPAERGQHPDGEPPAPGAAEAVAVPALGFGAALRDPRLWCVGGAAGIAFAGTTGVVHNGHALFTDAGHAIPRADTAMATVALGAALGKLAFGALGVRIGERATFATALLAQATSMAALPSCLGSYPLLLAAAVVFGLALGGVMPALTALLARLYGVTGFGPVLGYMAPMLVPFQMLGAPLAAYTRDALGSYELAIYGFALTTALATLALIPLAPRRSVAAPA